jgi:aromatic ring-opening dioxygenase LigB subunit
MTMVYACITPHGHEIISTLAGKNANLFLPTRKGVRLLAAQLKATKPHAIILASPHNLRLARHIGVVTSENSTGQVSSHGRRIALKAKCDVELASMIAYIARKRGILVVEANYGTASGPSSDLPMDWGTLIPLWFFAKRNRVETKIVVVAPSREIPIGQNFEFGRIVAEVSESERKRIAFIASADQAHTHRKSGPYGYSRKASDYDQRVITAIESDDLRSILYTPPDLIDAAKPDSLWQMAMLAGILDVVPMRGRLISYQVPNYYGMICAGYTRREEDDA